MVADRARYTDPARFREPFEACGDIHAVSVYVPFLNDHVPKIDADAKDDPLFLWCAGVPLGHPALDRDRTGDGLYHTRELGKYTVAGGLNDPPLSLAAFRPDHF